MTVPKSAQNVAGRAKDLFGALSSPTRTLIVVAAFAAVTLLVYVQFGRTKPDMVYLLGGQQLKPAQLQAICGVLDAEGLAQYQVDGQRVKVPRQLVQQYAAALSKRDDAAIGSYAPFDKAAEQASWFSSGTQDDRRWELARQKFLAQSIEQMPEVEAASVLIDRAPSSGLRNAGEVRATVTVKPRAGQELLPFRIRQIRALVVGGVARLAPENVAVVDLNGRALMELGADESSSDDVLTRMKAFEEHYAWKIRGVLAYVPGVTVTVSVELEPARGRRAEPPVGQGTESVSNAESNRGDVESRPTVTANSATELDPAESGNLEASPPNSPEAPVLAPRSLAVSVAVPYQAIPSRSLTSDGGGSETNQWTEQIRQRVASVIPKGVNATINVTSYPQPSDLLAARTSVARDSRLPWVFVIMALCVAGPTAAWIWLRRHSTRTRRAIARSGVSTPERSGVQQGRKVVAGESRRELVRVERDLARDGRAPHIIQPRITSFEDLRWLAPGSLQAVLGAVDGRLWAPALRGASRELCDRILMHMPSRAASLLRDEIEFPGPVRLGDVETAQQEVLEIVRRLDHTGDLVLEDREEILHE